MSAEAYANRDDYYVHILGLHSGIDVKFKAILTNFSDKLTNNFNPEQVYGRMDPIMTFQNTQRKITMSLQIPAETLGEATDNFRSLSRLMASQYPGYSERGNAATISTAPLHKIKFANWVTSGGTIGNVSDTGLVVAIEGVSFSPNLDAGVIENGPKLLPKQYDLELSMTVLHTEQLGWQDGYWMGADKYPYTEDADIRNEQSIGYTLDELEAQEQQEEQYQQAVKDRLLDQQQGAGAVSGGPEMSLAIYE
jgi:hypothetical protein